MTALSKKFDWLSEQIGGKKFLMGEKFNVADAYLFTILTWTKPLNIDLQKWPTLTAYVARVADRPGTQKALKGEGL